MMDCLSLFKMKDKEVLKFSVSLPCPKGFFFLFSFFEEMSLQSCWGKKKKIL